MTEFWLHKVNAVFKSVTVASVTGLMMELSECWACRQVWRRALCSAPTPPLFHLCSQEVCYTLVQRYPTLGSDIVHSHKPVHGRRQCTEKMEFPVEGFLCSSCLPASVCLSSISVLLYIHKNRKAYQGRGAQYSHLDFNTAPELCLSDCPVLLLAWWFRPPSDEQSKQHIACWNLHFRLHRPKMLDQCLWKEHRHMLCLGYNSCLVSLFV